MRFLHVIASVNPAHGGPIEGVIRTAEVWREGGHEVELASLDPPSAPWVEACPLPVAALGVDAGWYRAVRPYCPPLRYGYSPHFAPWLARHAGDYDAIILNGLWNYTTLGSRLALRRRRTPYVAYTHGMLDPWFRRQYPIKHALKQIVWLVSEGPLLRDADAVLFTTEDERELARNAFWPYRLRERVVGYGTADVGGDDAGQIAAFRTTTSVGNRRFLLFLGRIHPKKGCDLLIRAFARVAGRSSDLDLVIAGPDQVGWVSELRALAERLEVHERIHWPGMLNGDRKWGAFKACEAFVLPSHQENFGVVVAEALACAKPVLISDKVNIWREVAENRAGLVDSDDLTGAERLLESFLGLDAAGASAMGQRGRECFQRKFEIHRSSKILLDLLSELVAQRRASWATVLPDHTQPQAGSHSAGLVDRRPAPDFVELPRLPKARRGDPDVTVIILTYNEAKHIARCIDSVKAIASEIFVIDSFSTDDTARIAAERGAVVLEHAFVNYAQQFQWALDNVPATSGWIMRLDADEIVEPDLAEEIATRLPKLEPEIVGVNLKRKVIFLGRWIRFGGRFPIRLLRIWRRGQGRIENRWMDEHIMVWGGRVTTFDGGFRDHNLNSLSFFIEKHNKYATREALDALNQKYNIFPRDEALSYKTSPLQAAFKRTVKERMFNRIPFWIGSTGYFLSRYIVQLGFLDGVEGLIYHFLQGYWYRFLVGAKLREMEMALAGVDEPADRRAVLSRLTGYTFD
jgi:glycosyltransferase involved in cell wall biosynthesis